MAMLVMDKQDYIRKAKNILGQIIYRSIPYDPTNKCKEKLTKNPEGIKKGVRHVLPSLWPPKNTKKDTHLRPLVSSRDSVTHEIPKKIEGILQFLSRQATALHTEHTILCRTCQGYKTRTKDMLDFL